MNAILLLRVSSLKQDYDPQKDDLIEYAKQKGYKTFHIIETKESGLASLKNREGLDELKQFVKNNEDYKSLFITEISRIGRRQSVIHEVREYLMENNFKLYIKDLNLIIDNNSDNFNFLFNIYASYAESEVKSKKERFSRAKITYKKLGYFMGGKRLFGYAIEQIENSNRKIYTPHQNESEIVKKLFNWYLNGFNTFEQNPSIKQLCLMSIAEGFPSYTHSKRNLNKLLKEAAYTGKKVTSNTYSKTEYKLSGITKNNVLVESEMVYPKIIEEVLFHKVQEKLKTKNTNAEKSTKHTTLLSKKIRCKNCGNYFIADYRNHTNEKKHIYRCGSRTRVYSCSNKQSISLVMLESVIWQMIKNKKHLLFNAVNNLDEQKEKLNSQISNLEIKIEELDKAKNELLSLSNNMIANYKSGQNTLIETISSKIEKLDSEMSSLKRDIDVKRNEFSINKVDTLKDDLLSAEVGKIECDKFLMKKYFDSFIDEIDIPYHSNKFTFLRIWTRKFVENLPNNQGYENLVVPQETDRIIDYIPNSILIDKRNTQNNKFLFFNEGSNAKYMHGENLGIVKLDLLNNVFVNTCEILTFSEIFDLLKTNDFKQYVSFSKSQIFTLEKLKIYQNV